jgi:thiazole synthase
MELGAAAVLVNTAVAIADNPPLLAKAFAQAVEAGRAGYFSGLPAQKTHSEASSPLTGFLFEKPYSNKDQRSKARKSKI